MKKAFKICHLQYFDAKVMLIKGFKNWNVKVFPQISLGLFIHLSAFHHK